eukprot:2631510-Rhodomonas_salina.1
MTHMHQRTYRGNEMLQQTSGGEGLVRALCRKSGRTFSLQGCPARSHPFTGKRYASPPLRLRAGRSCCFSAERPAAFKRVRISHTDTDKSGTICRGPTSKLISGSRRSASESSVRTSLMISYGVCAQSSVRRDQREITSAAAQGAAWADAQPRARSCRTRGCFLCACAQRASRRPGQAGPSASACFALNHSVIREGGFLRGCCVYVRACECVREGWSE